MNERKHSAKWDRCVAKVGDSADSPEAVCTAALGDASYESDDGSGDGDGDGDLTEDDVAKIDAEIARRKEANPSNPAGPVLRASMRITGASRAAKFSRESAGGSIASYDAGSGRVRCCLITEGPGNMTDRHFYSREAIESGVVAFDGAKAYADHPSRREEVELPERSIDRIIGHYENLSVETTRDGRAALMADLVLNPADSDLMRHVRGLIQEAAQHAAKFPTLPPHTGLSINAEGEDAPGEIGGETWNIVTKFIPASGTSVDAVTLPAARGGWKQAAESLREAVRSGRSKEARAMKKGFFGKALAAMKAADEAKDAEGRKKATEEARAYMMAGEASEGGDESETEGADDSDKAPAPDDAEAKKKAAAEDEAARKKAAGDVHVAMPDGEDDETESEGEAETKRASLQAKAKNLTEAADRLQKTDPKLAESLRGDAKAIEAKLVDFGGLREALRTERRKNQNLESILTGRKLLAESGLPEGYLSIEELVGMSPAAQKAKIEAEKRRLQIVKESLVKDGVIGAGPRTSLRSRESGGTSFADSLAQVGVER